MGTSSDWNPRKFYSASAVWVLLLFLGTAASHASSEDIFQAVQAGDLQRVQALIDSRPDLIHARNEDQETPLHTAAAAGHIPIVKCLLSKGADLEAVTALHHTPLLYAAFRGHHELVDFLLRQGADVTLRDRYGRTLLYYPVQEGHAAVVEILLKKGCDITQEDGFGSSPLTTAVERGRVDIMKLFITHKALSAAGRSGSLVLHLAASQGHKAITDLMIAEGADMTSTSPRGGTLLHSAAMGRLEDLAAELIENRADPDALDKMDRTALHYAVREGSMPIVKLLTRAGANLGLQCRDGRVPLQVAEDWGRKEIADFLKAAGASEGRILQPEKSDQPWVKVRHIANEGFLITSQTKNILVDALFKNPYAYQDTPDELIEMMERSQPPFSRIDLMLFSHAHRDHFEPETALRVLMSHPETILVANQLVCDELKEAAGDDFAQISDRVKNINPEWGKILRTSFAGINLNMFPVNHADPEKPYMTLAFVLDVDGMKILHLGDLNPPANADFFKAFQLQKENISVAFIDPFFLLDESGRTSAEGYIKPREIVLMHLRPSEIGKYEAEVKRYFPDVHVFWESMEPKLFPTRGRPTPP